MLKVIPLTLKQANSLIFSLHRHHKPVVGHRFSIGVENDGTICGAAVVGRPVSKAYDAYNVAEVTRLVTDGTKNVCSILYSACARAAKAMGFIKIQTYILEDELGTSLKASGWLKGHDTKGGNWESISKPNRRQDQPQGPKQYWYKDLNNE